MNLKDLTPVTSSTIQSAGWEPSADATVGTLTIRFVGSKKSPFGQVWEYLNVTRAWYDAFMSAESKGKFHVAIKRDVVRHPARCIDDGTVAAV